VPNRGSRTLKGGPAAYLRASGQWPNGPLRRDAPTAAYWAAEISRRLAAALVGRSKTAVAQEVGMARTTLYDIVGGETWPDLVSIASLEEVLDVELWPRWGVGQTSDPS
jgi:hypothetical protein